MRLELTEKTKQIKKASADVNKLSGKKLEKAQVHVDNILKGISPDFPVTAIELNITEVD